MAEFSSFAPTPVTPENPRSTDGVVEGPRIVELFRIPTRYLRSIHLERDFNDITSLRHYIVTPPMVAIFSRIIEGLHEGSGRRAWRITGDYGTGKSSFALVLAHLLRDSAAPALAGVRETIDQERVRQLLNLTTSRMVPVLVTGAREPLVTAVARGVVRAVEQWQGLDKSNKILEDLHDHAAAVAMSGEPSHLLDLIDHLGRYVKQSDRTGILIVLDELGKFLEYAALHPELEDVYILQRLAEAAVRSSDCPFIVVGLLHQGFHAYAERLPSAARLEWEKVAGRFEEITFDQPLAHVAALVAGALNINTTQVPVDVKVSMGRVLTASLATGWFRTLSGSLMPLTLYPLHPTVLPVLVAFFSRFGQHERSLFSFLLSSEPFGLQSFAERPAKGDTWYRLADFYDYIRAVFGHRLAGASYRSHWLRIVGTLESTAIADLDIVELQILKTVAVLNVVDAEYLLATDLVLASTTVDGGTEDAVAQAMASLKRRRLLFQRGVGGGYRLWPNTSVNLESAFELAQRTLGPVDRVSVHLKLYVDATPVLARRHYIKTGTLRHFEVRYAEARTLPEVVAQPTSGDGLIVVVLCESAEECKAAVEQAVSVEVASRPEILVAVPPPLQDLLAEFQDARCWQWVVDNTPELGQDPYAAAEAARQVATSRRALLRKLAARFGFRGENMDVDWWREGKQFKLPPRGGLSAALSAICDELYPEAPYIRNELLNRQTLSSAAAAARMRLIERMFLAADKPELDFEPGKAPPEKSMYLSVLKEGNVHREEEGQFVLAAPPDSVDHLRLRPALMQILTLLEQSDDYRVPVSRILERLQACPYGIRSGVAILLLAVVVVANAHEIAVYEHGTFLQRFGASDFLRLVKQPTTFEFQLSRVVGVRTEVFAQLARMLAAEVPNARAMELLDVVRLLSVFAAQLPEYTRRTPNLPETAAKVRDALLAAREPAPLIFTDLPVACGLKPFATDEPADTQQVQQFVDRLRHALADLRDTYPSLLERIRVRIAHHLINSVRIDRASIAYRASRVVLAAREPRLQTFARCLADGALADDAWAEKVGSFVLAKPPARWTAADESRAIDEVDMLAATFCRVEATAFTGARDEPDNMAMRLLFTLSDGTEDVTIIRTRTEDEPKLEELTARLELALADSGELRVAALARMLKSSLARNGRLH